MRHAKWSASTDRKWPGTVPRRNETHEKERKNGEDRYFSDLCEMTERAKRAEKARRVRASRKRTEEKEVVELLGKRQIQINTN